jgi:hypothetical protein
MLLKNEKIYNVQLKLWRPQASGGRYQRELGKSHPMESLYHLISGQSYWISCAASLPLPSSPSFLNVYSGS